ncbi:MAG: hypothetical protein PHR36_05025 [Patescibacteria group bacterium]|nr:hypothetical protein [Patescibacteria group bacterium]
MLNKIKEIFKKYYITLIIFLFLLIILTPIVLSNRTLKNNYKKQTILLNNVRDQKNLDSKDNADIIACESKTEQNNQEEYRCTGDSSGSHEAELEDINIIKKTNAKTIKNNLFTFLAPENWEISSDVFSDGSVHDDFINVTLENTKYDFFISTTSLPNFINNYSACLDDCLYKGDNPRLFPFEYSCAKGYGTDHLIKFLSGEYINTATTPGPTGAEGSISYSKYFNNNVFTITTIDYRGYQDYKYFDKFLEGLKIIITSIQPK